MIASMLVATLLAQVNPAILETPEQNCIREAMAERAECVNACTSKFGDEMNSCVAACEDPARVHEACRMTPATEAAPAQ